jgi:hypothetical protein
MTGIVTAINVIVSQGLDGLLTWTTLQKWGISLLIAFPAVLLVAPLAVRITNYLVKND